MAQPTNPVLPAAPPHKAANAAVHHEPVAKPKAVEAAAHHEPVAKRKSHEREKKDSADPAAPDLVTPAPAVNVVIVPSLAAAPSADLIADDKPARRDAARDGLRARRWLFGLSSLLSTETAEDGEAAPSETGDRIECGAAGAAEDCVAETAPHVIAGVNDRVSQLAMAAFPGGALLRDPVLREADRPLRSRPRSRAECERRCGADGFCDPSSEYGCGGEFCLPHGKP